MGEGPEEGGAPVPLLLLLVVVVKLLLSKSHFLFTLLVMLVLLVLQVAGRCSLSGPARAAAHGVRLGQLQRPGRPAALARAHDDRPLPPGGSHVPGNPGIASLVAPASR